MQNAPGVHFQDGLKTRLFLPAWWVTAFESLWERAQAPLHAPGFLQAGFAPCFSLAALSRLALVLARLQAQLLMASAGEESLELSIDVWAKDEGMLRGRGQGALQEIFSALGGLKLLYRQGERYLVLPFFTDESWGQSHQASWSLQLQLNPYGGEFILGYADAHEDLGRQLRAHPSVRDVLAAKPPLLLWRSLWLELQGTEQALLVRLEKSMQWADNALNIQGVYGESLSNLFSHLPLGSTKQQALAVDRQLLILQRLQKKLGEHGFIQAAGVEDFVAFHRQEPPVQLIWKVTPHRFFGDDAWLYVQAVAQYFSSRRLTEKPFSGWIEAFIDEGQLQGDTLRLLQMSLPACGEIAVSRAEEHFWLADGNSLILFSQIFWEWLIRKQKGHIFPLPDEVKHTEAYALLPEQKWQVSELKNSFAIFIGLLKEQKFYREVVLKLPLASLAAPVSGGLYAKKTTGWEAYKLAKSSVKMPPSPKQEACLGEQATRAGHEIDEKNTILHKLQHMQRNASKDYAELMEKYLQSLDERSRKLLLDIQSRMQAEVFQQHMQHRLMRFLLEHPNLLA